MSADPIRLNGWHGGLVTVLCIELREAARPRSMVLVVELKVEHMHQEDRVQYAMVHHSSK